MLLMPPIAMFHKLLFLGPGGRTVYQGDVEGAKEYFDRMGYPCPANINPADHYMDVIGGVVKKTGGQFNPNVLFDEWSNHVAKEEMKAMHNDVLDGNEDEVEIIPVSGTKGKELKHKELSLKSIVETRGYYSSLQCSHGHLLLLDK